MNYLFVIFHCLFKTAGLDKLFIQSTAINNDSRKFYVVSSKFSFQFKFNWLKIKNVFLIDKLNLEHPKNRVFRELTPLAQLLCDATYEPSLAEFFEWYRNSNNQTYLKSEVIETSQVLHLEEILEIDGETYLCKVFGMDGNKIISTNTVEVICKLSLFSLVSVLIFL